jgi:uncharacterized protein (DUF58 family)
VDLSAFIHKYQNLNSFSKNVVEGFLTGLHKSPFHGFSVEFAEHRQYNTGESIKHLDWKLFSRTDKLFIKKYEDETNLRCQLLIDNSASMFVPKGKYSKFQFSVVAAACILQVLKKQRDAFGITFFNDKIDESTPIKSSTSHFTDCINLLQKNLYQENTHTKTHTGDVLNLLAEKIHRRSLVVIFTDLNEYSENREAFIKGLQHLHFRKHDILLFNVADKKLELDFEYEDVPTRFVDAETGESIKLNPQEIRSQYIKATKEYRKDLIDKCTQYKIDTYFADINNDLESTIGAFLRKRSGKS